MLLRAGPRQRIVPPLAADAARAVDDAAADDDAAAAAGAEYDAEDRMRAGSRAVHGFREGKTVGVVGKAQRPTECRRKIGIETPPVEPRRVRVLHEPRRRRQRARHADSDRCRPVGDGIEQSDEIADRAQWSRRSRRAELRSGDACARCRPRRAAAPRSWCRRDRCRCAPPSGRAFRSRPSRACRLGEKRAGGRDGLSRHGFARREDEQ